MVVAAAVLVASSSYFSSSAQAAAGTYIVYSCKSGVTDGWLAAETDDGSYVDHCPSGGMTAASDSKPGSSASWKFTAPSGTSVTAFSLYRYVLLGPSQLNGTPQYELSTFPDEEYINPWINYTSGELRSGWETESDTGIDEQGVEMIVWCGGGGSCPAYPSASFEIGYSTVTLKDPSLPEAKNLSGGLYNDDVLEGTEVLTGTATDGGSGTWLQQIRVDGETKVSGTIDDNGGKCGVHDGYWYYAQPCKTSTQIDFSLDTTSLSEGEHEISYELFDAAENKARIFTHTVTVDNIDPPVAPADGSGSVTGELTEGSTLSCEPGNFGGNQLTYSYRWRRGGTAISDATDSQYTITGNDLGYVLACEVTASNVEGSASQTITAGMANEVPQNKEAPTVSGEFTSGGTLTADPGSWSGYSNSYGYQWQRCSSGAASCGNISGATASTYKVTDADFSSYLRVVVTATNNLGSAKATSAAGEVEGDTGTTPKPVLPAPPTAVTPSTGQTAAKTTSGCNGDRCSTTAALSAHFASPTAKHRRVGFGRRLAVRGKLVDQDGQPIGDAVVQVFVKAKKLGADWVGKGGIATRSDGAFTYVATVGASRTLRFAYKAHREDSEPTAETTIDLVVRAGVSLRARPRHVRNGRSVVLTGRLKGGPLPAGGKLVNIQVKVRGRWQTIATTRTRHGGRFRYSERFTRTFRPWTFRFRAVSLAERAYPYGTGRSRVVKVRVG